MIYRLLFLTLLTIAVAGSALAQDPSTHVVKAGETLYRIATTNGMRVDELKRLNGLTDDRIQIGQVLRLAPQAERLQDDTPTDLVEIEPADEAIGASDVETDDAAIETDEAAVETDEAAVETDEAAVEPDDAAALVSRGVSTYIAKEGDTLYSIAADLGTKAYVLFTLNKGIRAPLESRTPIVVPATGAIEPAGRTYAVGSAAIFPETYDGRVMAGGSAYDPTAFIVAHRELPFDTILIVENAETGRASFARVADRGPVDPRRLMEMSPALAAEIGIESGERVRVLLVE